MSKHLKLALLSMIAIVIGVNLLIRARQKWEQKEATNIPVRVLVDGGYMSNGLIVVTNLREPRHIAGDVGCSNLMADAYDTGLRFGWLIGSRGGGKGDVELFMHAWRSKNTNIINDWFELHK